MDHQRSTEATIAKEFFCRFLYISDFTEFNILLNFQMHVYFVMSWTRWSLWVPSILRYSVILWLYKYSISSKLCNKSMHTLFSSCCHIME